VKDELVLKQKIN